MTAKTGTDFMLESLLRLAGVDIENAKQQILSLGKKFHDQDALLHRIENNQKTIMQHFGIVENINVQIATEIPDARATFPRIAGNGTGAG